MKAVIKSYSQAFFKVIILVFLAYKAAIFVNQYHWLSEKWINWIQVCSIIPEATAVFGYLGGLQTWGGNTPPEKLNSLLLKILSTGGFFLLVFAFQLKP